MAKTAAALKCMAMVVVSKNGKIKNKKTLSHFLLKIKSLTKMVKYLKQKDTMFVSGHG